MDHLDQLNKARRDCGTFCSNVGICCTRLEPGYCEAECDITEFHKNPYGMAHGGLIFTLLDLSGCSAASEVGEGKYRPLVTQHATIHYLRPATGKKLTARASVIKSGKNIALVSVDIFDEAEKHVARGDLTAFYTGEAVASVDDCYPCRQNKGL